MTRTTATAVMRTKKTTMTNPPGKSAPTARKVLQQLRAAGEQNERMLVRSITTILASVGTLVGWMVLAAQMPDPEAVAAEPVVEAPTETPWPTETATALPPTATIAFAPIPTLRAVPGRAVLPTLMPTAAVGVSAAAPLAADTASSAPAPTAPAQPLRVVVVPTAAPAAPPNQPAAAQPQPQPTAAPAQPAPPPAPRPTAKPKPTPAGNSKGSK
ncbi:MAG: hypothetical protein RLZZ297_1154 [Chloroflexota bacterium]|jgi:hypothetical protein